MSTKITRRTFLKISGAGAAAATVLTGCGPAARYVTRKPYYSMPEFSKVGESTYYATTCRECPAGCGLIVRTMEGRAIKAEGNPAHPVSQGKICSRGLTAVQGLYNPDRVTGPIQRARGAESATPLEWEAAIGVVAGALKNGGQTAFLLGPAPDHLYELAGEIAQAAGAPAPARYSVTGMLDGRATLLAAAANRYGQPALPFFDVAGADLVFSFGADFLGTWVSPVAFGKAFGAFRRPAGKPRGYLVSFEPRMGVTSGAADEWIPVAPGSEGVVAQAIGRLAAGETVDTAAIEKLTGVGAETLEHLAALWQAAAHPLAVPGGAALSHFNGRETAEAVMALNESRINVPGGVFFLPEPVETGTFAAVQELVGKMQSGQVQALFIHGVNPLFDLPPALGFADALKKVKLVVSFATFPDETALQSDYVLPDHSALESFGYQKPQGGSTRPVLSAAQPVVAPLYDTRATADVLIAAAKQAGLPIAYSDEVAFIESKLSGLLDAGGSIGGATTAQFFSRFLQHGGWWGAPFTGEALPVDAAPPAAAAPQSPAEGQFHLVTYATHFGDGSGANRPWLQETPDPMTTVTWNTWVEINPHTAEELGIHHDDVVRIKSAEGEIELPAYLYPAIRPDTVAIPFGQGHTALGRYAEGRGRNPLALVGANISDSGDLAFGDTLVTIEATGKRRPLARLESLKGVYGEH